LPRYVYFLPAPQKNFHRADAHAKKFFCVERAREIFISCFALHYNVWMKNCILKIFTQSARAKIFCARDARDAKKICARKRCARRIKNFSREKIPARRKNFLAAPRLAGNSIRNDKNTQHCLARDARGGGGRLGVTTLDFSARDIPAPQLGFRFVSYRI